MAKTPKKTRKMMGSTQKAIDSVEEWLAANHDGAATGAQIGPSQSVATSTRNLTQAARMGKAASSVAAARSVTPKAGLLARVGGLGGMIGLGSLAFFGPSMVRDGAEALDQTFGSDLMGHRRGARIYGRMAEEQAQAQIDSELSQLWEQESISNVLDAVEPRPEDNLMRMANMPGQAYDQFVLGRAEQELLSQLAVKESGPGYLEMAARLGIT